MAGKHKVLSESRIIRRFGVSSMTARRVLNDLAIEGLVLRQVGRGSIVCAPAQKKTREFGVVFFDVFNPQSFFIEEIMRGLAACARQHGDRLALFAVREPVFSDGDRASLLHLVRHHFLDGLFVLSPLAPRSMALFRQAGVPCVCINNYYPGLGVPSVVYDHMALMETLRCRLVSNGIERTALVNLRCDGEAGVERGRHFALRAWRKHFKPYRAGLLYDAAEEDGAGQQAMRYFYSLPPENRPEAVIVAGHQLSLQAQAFMQQCRDWRPIMIYVLERPCPELNSITPDYYAQGQTAFAVMEKLLNNAPVPELIMQPFSLQLNFSREACDAKK